MKIEGDYELREVDCQTTDPRTGEILTYKGVRLYRQGSEIQFGEDFQKKTRSLECQVSYIVWNKYKRKHDLSSEELDWLVTEASRFVSEKPDINKDFLTQKVSESLKRRVSLNPVKRITEKANA